MKEQLFPDDLVVISDHRVSYKNGHIHVHAEGRGKPKSRPPLDALDCISS